jgi:hypothetical protein
MNEACRKESFLCPVPAFSLLVTLCGRRVTGDAVEHGDLRLGLELDHFAYSSTHF